MDPENKRIDKVALIHIEDRKMMALRSKGKDKFYMPGGKREHGESDLEVLARELEEETGIRINIETAEFFGEFKDIAHGKYEGWELTEQLYTADFEGEIKPNSEIEEVGWFNSEDIGSDSLTGLGHKVLEALQEKNLID